MAEKNIKWQKSWLKKIFIQSSFSEHAQMRRVRVELKGRVPIFAIIYFDEALLKTRNVFKKDNRRKVRKKNLGRPTSWAAAILFSYVFLLHLIQTSKCLSYCSNRFDFQMYIKHNKFLFPV